MAIIKNFNEYTEKTHKGVEFFNNQKYEDALNIFLELSEYNPDNYKVYETLSLIYLKLNNIQAAEESYKKAVGLFSGKSGVKFKFQSFEEAVSELESIDKLQAMYEKECGDDNIPDEKSDNSSIGKHRLPLMMGMRYMADGEFKKAEELLIQHRERYFKNKKNIITT